MQPLDITPFELEIAIRWPEGEEVFISLEQLRRHCPCASCSGEKDILGKTHQAARQPYSHHSFTLRRFDRVGNYGIQPLWADGHSTGIFTWEYLRLIPKM